MAEPTVALIDKMRQAHASGPAGQAVEAIVLRVLCHRADHTASKHLKATMKIPKSKGKK